MADDDQAALAETMGFSSFGNQNPSKKRRLSPNPQPEPPCASANTEEINLEDDDDGEDNATAGPASTSLPERPPHGAQQRGAGRQHHARNNNGGIWYEGYYDNLSNSNPWERLEARMGLEARGAWPSEQGNTG